MTLAPVPTTSVDALVARYDVFLVDAYGVLVSTRGPFPGAAAFLERLDAAGKTWFLVTNDASRTPDTLERRYQGFGLPIRADRVLTSGAMLAEHFAGAGLVGRPTIVLGTPDSHAYVERAGGVIVAPDDRAAEVVVAADDDGFPFLDHMSRVLGVLFHRFDAGLPTHLLLPNPDLVFPMGDGDFGFTSGSMALLFEAALARRYPGRAPRFTPLGKPHPPMYRAAHRRAGGGDKANMVMLGDQLETDIRGALDYGIDAVLVETGISRLHEHDDGQVAVRPTWVLPRI